MGCLLDTIYTTLGRLDKGINYHLCATRYCTPAQVVLAAHARRDLPNYYRLNKSIHEAINLCTGNDVLVDTYRSVNTRIQHLRFKSNFVQEKWDQAVKEHDAMLKTLTERDEKKMRALLEQHLLNKRDAVIEGIKNQQQDITA